MDSTFGSASTIGTSSVASSRSLVERVPAPVAQSKPFPPSPLGEDSIARPNAQPSPNPQLAAPARPGDSLPLLIAGGVLLGGAALLAAPAVGEGGAIAAGALKLGEAAVRSRTFLVAAGREFATEYRAAATNVAHTKLSDPKELGKALGAQTWTATEELGRSSIVGAGLAAGVSAVQHASSAIAGLIEKRTHDPAR